MLTITLFECIQVALMATAAFVVGRQPVRRTVAAFLVFCTFVLSWFAPGNRISRAALAGIAIGSVILTVELAFNSKPRFLSRERLRFYPGRRSPVGSLRIIGHIFVEVLIGGAACLILLQTRHPNSTAVGMLRLAAGVAMIYAVAALAFELIRLGLWAMGMSAPLLHRTPIAARSVGEFWGQRWNLVISAWLRQYFYLPLARRRRPGLGIMCAFLVSGALHGWPMMVAVSSAAGCTTLAFFLLQGVFVLAEQRLQIHTWPDYLARAWTLTALLLPSPLYIDPGLRLFNL